MKPGPFPRSKPKKCLAQSLFQQPVITAICFFLAMQVVSAEQTMPGMPSQTAKSKPVGNAYSIEETNWTVLHAPTPPPNEPELSVPWAPQELVMIGLSFDHLLSSEGLLETYIQFLELVLPVKRVLVAYHRKDRRKIPQFIDMLESNPTLQPLLDRLDFLACENSSMWIRDFGPVFGKNKEGKLLVVDLTYSDPRIMISNQFLAESVENPIKKDSEVAKYYATLEKVRGTDITPAIVAGHLHVTENIPTQLTRPSIILPGGDLILVDSKTALTSRATLEANSGRADFFEDSLNSYMGIERVVYIEQLPGETIEHVDFIVQVCGPDSILIASPVEFDDLGRIGNRLLKKELFKVLNKNRETITKAFPQHKIIEVPMPPPILIGDNDIRVVYLNQVLQSISSNLNLTDDPVSGIKNPYPENWKIPEKVMNRIFLDTGALNLRSWEAVDKVLTHYLDRPVKELLRLYTDNTTRYRTYLNSLQIMGDDGREYIILPRYSARNPQEVDLLADMEKEVSKAYSMARPNATLLWMDCDTIIKNLGAVHCMAITMPK